MTYFGINHCASLEQLFEATSLEVSRISNPHNNIKQEKKHMKNHVFSRISLLGNDRIYAHFSVKSNSRKAKSQKVVSNHKGDEK